MSYSLNSLKRGVIQGIVSGSTRGVSEGDTRGLDYSSFVYIYIHIHVYHTHTYKFAPYLVGNFEIWMLGLVVGWLVKYKCDPDEVLES